LIQRKAATGGNPGRHYLAIGPFFGNL